MALTYNGTQWSAPVAIDDTNYIQSLSCPSSTFCVAVDGLLPEGFVAGSGTGRAVTFNGVEWSAPLTIDSGQIIAGVSCPSERFCLAVDQAGRAVIGVR
jgi:hypothetical protein